jgi:hypothetical protein
VAAAPEREGAARVVEAGALPPALALLDAAGLHNPGVFAAGCRLLTSLCERPDPCYALGPVPASGAVAVLLRLLRGSCSGSGAPRRLPQLLPEPALCVLLATIDAAMFHKGSEVAWAEAGVADVVMDAAAAAGGREGGIVSRAAGQVLALAARHAPTAAAAPARLLPWLIRAAPDDAGAASAVIGLKNLCSSTRRTRARS